MAAPKLERLRAADVCQLTQLQPYVLRSWEAEFPDLGQQNAGGPRVYSRADVERVLRIRELVYGEGLTLSGARRRLEEARDEGETTTVRAFALLDEPTRTRLKSVRAALAGVLARLEQPPPGQLAAAAVAAAPAPAEKARRGRR